MQTMTQSSFLQSHQHTRRPRFWSSVSFCTHNTHIQLKFDQYSCWIISMHKMFHHNNEFETKRAFQGLSTDNECRPTDPTHQSWKTDLTNSERVSEPYNAMTPTHLSPRSPAMLGSCVAHGVQYFLHWEAPPRQQMCATTASATEQSLTKVHIPPKLQWEYGNWRLTRGFRGPIFFRQNNTMLTTR